MNLFPITVLLVEDDPTYTQKVRLGLSGSGLRRFQIEWVANLSDTLLCLAREHVDVVLLNLTLPDLQGLPVFDQVFKAAPEALILVLCHSGDEDVARQAVQSGAEDYFVQEHLDAHWLPRALRYLVERKSVQMALRDSQERFRTISDSSPLGIFVSDEQGHCVYTNAAYLKLSGLSAEQALGSNWSAVIEPEDRRMALDAWSDPALEASEFHTEVRLMQSESPLLWVRVNGALMHSGKTLSGFVHTFEDISERKATELGLRLMEEALFEEKERAQVTLNSIGDAVLSTDITGRITFMNLVAEKLTGWAWTDAVGLPLEQVFKIFDSKTREIGHNPAQRAIAENRTVGLAADCVLIGRNGEEFSIEDSAAPIHNREGLVSGAVIVFHDVSAARVMALDMRYQAQHDLLTGLANRGLLTECLRQAIGLARRHDKQVAVLFIDLDYFKHVNDSLGHALGDELLQLVAQRLQTGVRTTDTVCRLGGDEFVILLSEIAAQHDAALVAETLRETLNEPYHISGNEINLTMSIGISVYPDESTTVDNPEQITDTLLQNADTAMYHAKTRGRDNYQFFNAEMSTQINQRLLVESRLRRALKQQEFILHYQPKVDLSSGEMTGVEALIRWQDPDRGLVFPGAFISIAEGCGMIIDLGHWVMREACRQSQAWLDDGLCAVPVAVNVSALEFRHPQFVAGVAQILKETGLAAHYLEIELTESILMHEAESSVLVLDALRAMGIQLTIDDFGTGYSSLSYLKRFPIHSLKIDQSFVLDIATNSDDATIVSAVIGLGGNMKKRVIAEGVETLEQLAFLQMRKCKEGQGYLLSPPVAAIVFSQFLHRQQPPFNTPSVQTWQHLFS